MKLFITFCYCSPPILFRLFLSNIYGVLFSSNCIFDLIEVSFIYYKTIINSCYEPKKRKEERIKVAVGELLRHLRYLFEEGVL